MSTNLLNRKIGDDRFSGMKIFRCFRNGTGEWFAGGAKYVVFDQGILVGECSSITEAERQFLEGFRAAGPRLSDYEGVDKRLR